jgi:hypothetical protein
MPVAKSTFVVDVIVYGVPYERKVDASDPTGTEAIARAGDMVPSARRASPTCETRARRPVPRVN